jgi:Icc-related predicted phosphoesterase
MMGTKKESPERLETLRSSNADCYLCGDIDYEVTKLLSNRQKKIYDLLKAGKFSAADITIALGYCDPRSYIRELRNRGITVLDEWISKNGTHYKRYWIKKTDDAL